MGPFRDADDFVLWDDRAVEGVFEFDELGGALEGRGGKVRVVG